ncbi:hypothetical protein D9758_013885 [Tetrapyrgos nigripes]|uniref:Jacalin-type lectin domain-containing protein n=1 Tax=Tetrapyrgos nigripes TaxID=182062 RepID=A0A8H5CN87_9AGAR|nr:hypothetical protein D9758_013885 [Tetrapyrgos nigripes]
MTGEAIVSMTIWSDLDVDAIQFVTTFGRVSPKYGGSGGSPRILHGNLGDKARALMAWKGTSDTIVRSLEPVWSDTQDLSGTHVIVGESKGGTGGNAFDMLDTVGDPLTTRLTSITVDSGSAIDAIECKFQVGNKTVSSGKKGGSGGSAHTFELRSGEQITRIEGRANTEMCKLQFFTNQGRSSDVYGSDTGDPFVWLPPSYDPNNPGAEVTGLVCFEGASGTLVDRLAPVWAANPPLSYELIIDSFDEGQLQRDGKVEAAWDAEQVKDNSSTRDSLKSTFSWSMSAEKTSTITFSQSTRSLISIGKEVLVEVSAKGEVGIPFVGEGDVEKQIAVEVSGEKGWGNEMTDGKTVTRSYTETHSDEVIIRPKSEGQGKAIGYRMECANLQWTGKMVIIYSDGSTRTIQPVSGTLTSSSLTKIHATYTSVPLK